MVEDKQVVVNAGSDVGGRMYDVQPLNLRLLTLHIPQVLCGLQEH